MRSHYAVSQTSFCVLRENNKELFGSVNKKKLFSSLRSFFSLFVQFPFNSLENTFHFKYTKSKTRLKLVLSQTSPVSLTYILNPPPLHRRSAALTSPLCPPAPLCRPWSHSPHWSRCKSPPLRYLLSSNRPPLVTEATTASAVQPFLKGLSLSGALWSKVKTWVGVSQRWHVAAPLTELKLASYAAIRDNYRSQSPVLWCAQQKRACCSVRCFQICVCLFFNDSFRPILFGLIQFKQLYLSLSAIPLPMMRSIRQTLHINIYLMTIHKTRRSLCSFPFLPCVEKEKALWLEPS